MKYIAKKCGVRFQPPAMILIYENEAEGKSRQRIMPVRNFSKFSDCTRAAEQLKNNPRHKSYLEQVSLKQLEKLFVFTRFPTGAEPGRNNGTDPAGNNH